MPRGDRNAIQRSRVVSVMRMEAVLKEASHSPTANPDTERVFRAFFSTDGRLTQIPAKRSKRLVVLDRLSQEFPPGESFSEVEVNRRLRAFHPDVASLRRYLVDEGFMSRRSGWYWRSGGTFDI